MIDLEKLLCEDEAQALSIQWSKIENPTHERDLWPTVFLMLEK